MTPEEEKLVQRIADEVMRAMRERVGPAKVQPPAGTCTGDYSKFTEPPEVSTPTPIPVIALTGIVTATQLQSAMKSAPDGVAVLAADARLTPLANDLARQHPDKVRRVGAVEPPSAGGAAPNPPWVWWIDGHCPAVAAVVHEHREQLVPSSAGHRPSALAQVVRDLAGAIKSKRATGGLLFVHNAAQAICFANRCASIRAVVGTCGEAVEQGIADLGANVLVIEYPHHGQRAIGALVDRMLQQTPKAPPAVERDLSELQRCG